MDVANIRQWFRRCLAADAGSSGDDGQDTCVGELELAGFQRRAVARGLDIARTFGGVLLADAVGLGKTRVSLGIARALARDARLRSGAPVTVVVYVPARLRRQWEEALARAQVREFEVVTHTALSRGSPEALAPAAALQQVVVVDEAHRFRNPRAKRSRALAQLAARAPVVLASATPVCNSQWDLYHLLSLFLAEHDLRGAIGHNLREAFDMAERGDFDLTELVEQVAIRRTRPPSQAGFGRRPNVSLRVLEYAALGAERWLWQHLERELRAMSMELFRHDWPRGLLVEYVLKRWESGADALAATLGEMVAFHQRWLEADGHGRTLSRDSFRQLFGGELGRRQEVFPFLFDGPGGAPAFRRELVRADLEVLDGLARRANEVADGADGKRQAILDMVAQCRQKVLIFTGYQHAARGLYDALVRRLGPEAKVGLVTGDTARATGLGRARADEIIRRFAPHSNGVRALEPHQQIDVLVSTDCLAEGVNLQDCARVVLADLPYSPLAVEQRIGRLVRPGGPHERVTVYLPRPESWSDSLGLRRRLDHKLDQAAKSGTGFVAAGKVGTAHVGPREVVGGPLAALTRLDALAATLEAADAPAIEPGFWRARARHGPARLWARVAVHERRGRRWMWCVVRDGQPAEMRLHALLDALVRDADLSAPVERAQPDADLLEAAEAAVRRRENLLRAARLAPFPLRLDSPQRRVWSTLSGYVDRGELEVDEEALDRLRHNLLRSFPRGSERRLGQLCDADLRPVRLWAQVCAIVDAVPAWSPRVHLEIVAGLYLY